MCLDFDNEKEIPNPDYPHFSTKPKISVKDISLSLEQAMDQFRDSAMFIYTSFSHKKDHPKFRVVFAFDETITDPADIDSTLQHYKQLYPDADPKCFERARMFYGGTECFILNLSNRVPIVRSKGGGGLGDYNRFKVLSNTIIVTHTPHQLDNGIMNRIELIKQKSKDRLKQLLNKPKQQFYTYAETMDYIKQQDITELLGVNENDRCIFHDDTSPSASIFRNSESNHHLYRCHSSNCSFGTGTITKVIERLTGLNKMQSNKFIRDIYNIEFIQTDWQKEQIELIDENIRYLQSGDMEFEYPTQYKIMHNRYNYIPDLIQFLTLAKEYVAPEHYTEQQTNLLFFTSLGHFAKFMGKSEGNEKRIGDKLALFAYFSYIHKLKESEIPKHLLDKAKFYLLQNKNGRKSRKLIGYYEIPSFNDDMFSFAEKKAAEYNENHFTMGGWGYDMLFRALGEEEASRVYPQSEGKKPSKRSDMLTKEMELAVSDLINSKGWVTEKEVIHTIRNHIEGVSKTAAERHIKKILGEMIQKYGLSRVQANKKVLKDLGIDEILSDSGFPSYPFILIKSIK